MTAFPKSTIKSYFLTGDRPTQSQFGDLIDSYADASAAVTSMVGDVIATINNGVATTAVVSGLSLNKLETGLIGQIVYYNSNGTLSKLAAGTSGQSLQMGTTIPAWVSASTGGGIVFPNNGYAASRFYFGVGAAPNNSAGITVTANRNYAIVFAVGVTTTFTKIGIEVTTGAGTSARLGVYNFASGLPTSLILDAGTVSVSSIGQKEATISLTLNPGVYAITAVFDNTPVIRGPGVTPSMQGPYFGESDTDGTLTPSALYNSLTFGVLPNPFGGSVTYLSGSVTVPLIWLRA